MAPVTPLALPRLHFRLCLGDFFPGMVISPMVSQMLRRREAPLADFALVRPIRTTGELELLQILPYFGMLSPNVAVELSLPLVTELTMMALLKSVLISYRALAAQGRAALLLRPSSFEALALRLWHASAGRMRRWVHFLPAGYVFKIAVFRE